MTPAPVGLGFWQRPETFADPVFELLVRFRDPLTGDVDAAPSMDLRPVPIRKGSGAAQQVVGSRLAEGRDKNHEKRIKAWRQQLQAAARAVRDREGPIGKVPLQGPLAVEIVFLRPRNQGDFGTGRNAGELKASAAAFPVKRPDQGKQARLIEDALTGIVWGDDAQIVDPRYPKRYGRQHAVRVRVWRLEALEADRLEAERRREALAALFALSDDVAELVAGRLDGIADDLADPQGSLGPDDVIEKLRALSRTVRLEAGA